MTKTIIFVAVNLDNKNQLYCLELPLTEHIHADFDTQFDCPFARFHLETEPIDLTAEEDGWLNPIFSEYIS